MVCGSGWRGMGFGLVSSLKRGWRVCDQVFPAGSGGICFYAVDDGAFMTEWMSRVLACAGDVGWQIIIIIVGLRAGSVAAEISFCVVWVWLNVWKERCGEYKSFCAIWGALVQ